MKLFEKLIQRKVPICFVRLLKHWYKEQTMQIKRGKYFLNRFMCLMVIGDGTFFKVGAQVHVKKKL